MSITHYRAARSALGTYAVRNMFTPEHAANAGRLVHHGVKSLKQYYDNSKSKGTKRSHSPKGEQEKRLRKEEPKKEEKMPSNSHETCAEEGESGQGAQLGVETQLDPFTSPWTHFKNTENAILRYYHTALISGGGYSVDRQTFDVAHSYHTTGTSYQSGQTLVQTGTNNPLSIDIGGSWWNFEYPYMLELNMNTPYNIINKYATGAAQPITFQTPTITSGGATPQWIQFFDNKYQYYHQLELHWEVELVFGNSAAASDFTGYYIFYKYINEDSIPVQWVSNATYTTGPGKTLASGALGPTTSGGGNTYANCTPDDYFRMHNMKYKHVVCNSIEPTLVTLSGTYKTGQCKMDVQTLATDIHSASNTSEGWIQVKNVPSLQERLAIIIVADNAMTTSVTQQQIGMRIKTQHHLQFKDLTSVYKFPLPSNQSSTGEANLFWPYAGQ